MEVGHKIKGPFRILFCCELCQKCPHQHLTPVCLPNSSPFLASLDDWLLLPRVGTMLGGSSDSLSHIVLDHTHFSLFGAPLLAFISDLGFYACPWMSHILLTLATPMFSFFLFPALTGNLPRLLLHRVGMGRSQPWNSNHLISHKVPGLSCVCGTVC